MHRLLIGFGVFMVASGLFSALLGFAETIKDGHVHCCHADMGITPDLTQALDALEVTDGELQQYFAATDPEFFRLNLQQLSAESRGRMITRLANDLTDPAKDLYLEKIYWISDFGFAAGGLLCLGGTIMVVGGYRLRKLTKGLRTVVS